MKSVDFPLPSRWTGLPHTGSVESGAALYMPTILAGFIDTVMRKGAENQ